MVVRGLKLLGAISGVSVALVAAGVRGGEVVVEDRKVCRTIATWSVRCSSV